MGFKTDITQSLALEILVNILSKLWLLTISLNCIEMNRRLLVNNDSILHSLLGLQ